MTGPISLTVDAGIGVITSDHPPVNALSLSVRTGLQAALQRALADPTVEAILLACDGRTFFAGADIGEFDKPIEEPSVPALVAMFEASSKPVVAAIHGTALGGGFELALSCHYRIAADSARVGLPEVLLGILPGAGGTQRVARLVGAARALEILTSGRQIAMDEALALGLVDEVVQPEALRGAAKAFARSVAALPPPRIRDRSDRIDQDRQNLVLFDDFLAEHAEAFRGFQAPRAIVEAIRAAVTLPFDQACAQEWTLFEALVISPEAAAQRAHFFALREAAKPPAALAGPAASLQSVSVIGSGDAADALSNIFSAAGLRVDREDAPARAADLVLRVSQDGREAIVHPPGAADHSPQVRLRFHPSIARGRLIEIIHADETSPGVASLVASAIRPLGKPSLWSRGGPFVGGLLDPLVSRAALMIGKGVDVATLREALIDFGFSASGDFMQSFVETLAAESAPASQSMSQPDQSYETLLEDLISPVIALGQSLIDTDTVSRASDIDVAAVIAHGWPVFRRGPGFYIPNAYGHENRRTAQ